MNHDRVKAKPTGNHKSRPDHHVKPSTRAFLCAAKRCQVHTHEKFRTKERAQRQSDTGKLFPRRNATHA